MTGNSPSEKRVSEIKARMVESILITWGNQVSGWSKKDQAEVARRASHKLWSQAVMLEQSE